jgi:hypothetical protein
VLLKDRGHMTRKGSVPEDENVSRVDDARYAEVAKKFSGLLNDRGSFIERNPVNDAPRDRRKGPPLDPGFGCRQASLGCASRSSEVYPRTP